MISAVRDSLPTRSASRLAGTAWVGPGVASLALGLRRTVTLPARCGRESLGSLPADRGTTREYAFRVVREAAP